MRNVVWKLEETKPIDGETSTKEWSSTHVEKAAKGNSLWEEGDMFFSPAFVSGYQLKNKQPNGHGEIFLLFFISMDKTLKMKKYIWDFIQGITERCVAFNEIIQTK